MDRKRVVTSGCAWRTAGEVSVKVKLKFWWARLEFRSGTFVYADYESFAEQETIPRSWEKNIKYDFFFRRQVTILWDVGLFEEEKKMTGWNKDYADRVWVMPLPFVLALCFAKVRQGVSLCVAVGNTTEHRFWAFVIHKLFQDAKFF